MSYKFHAALVSGLLVNETSPHLLVACSRYVDSIFIRKKRLESLVGEHTLLYFEPFAEDLATGLTEFFLCHVTHI